MLSIADQSVNENVVANQGQIQVTLSEAVNHPVYFDVVTEAGTANETGYLRVDDGVNNRVEILANQTQFTFDIGIVDDSDSEGDENFTVRIVRAFGARFSNRAYTSTSATVTIVDNEGGIEAGQLALFDATVSESGGVANIRVQVGGAGGASEDVVFIYSTSAGTATAGTDYTEVSNSNPVTIPAGQSFIDIPVTILDDTEVDNGETFTVTVTPQSGVTDTAPIQATITINDNDEAASSSSSGGGGQFGLLGLMLIGLLGAARRFRLS